MGVHNIYQKSSSDSHRRREVRDFRVISAQVFRNKLLGLGGRLCWLAKLLDDCRSRI